MIAARWDFRPLFFQDPLAMYVAAIRVMQDMQVEQASVEALEFHGPDACLTLVSETDGQARSRMAGQEANPRLPATS